MVCGVCCLLGVRFIWDGQICADDPLGVKGNFSQSESLNHAMSQLSRADRLAAAAISDVGLDFFGRLESQPKKIKFDHESRNRTLGSGGCASQSLLGPTLLPLSGVPQRHRRL